jgi:uncharacterized membrane protein YbaN (DUF454 family)
MENIRKSGWIIAGTASLVLGVLGIFLPVLPTTPFLLLTAFCYGRGSKRFYDWLLDRSWFGSYIKKYQSGQGISPKLKALTIILLWLTMGSSVALMGLAWWLDMLLAFVAISVTIHLLSMKSLPPGIPLNTASVQSMDASKKVHETRY